MEREGKTADLTFEIETGPEGFAGTFTSLRQRVMEYPLDAVEVEGDGIRLVLGGGDVLFQGDRMGDRIQGTLTQGEASGTFRVERLPGPALPYTGEDVSFSNGDVTLAGSLYVPVGQGPFPAVAFLHGAGAEVRWGASRFFADHLARRGIAALIYDKRGTGESTGDWRTADLEDLADDLLAGVALLAADSRIDAQKIGIYGHSQGAAIAPVVIVRSEGAVSFAIAGAAAGVPMWESEIHSLQSQVRALGTVSGESLARADSFAVRIVQVAREGGRGYETLQAEAGTARERGEPWIDLLEPPPVDFYFWKWYPAIAEHDPTTYWERVLVPVLVIEAEEDVYIPVERSIGRIDEALQRAGNEDYTILVLPAAPHNFILQPGPGEPFDWPRLAPGFADLMVAWIRYRTEDHGPSSGARD
jgi:alpha-beta hydrolase superfamily lysophospholipase